LTQQKALIAPAPRRDSLDNEEDASSVPLADRGRNSVWGSLLKLPDGPKIANVSGTRTSTEPLGRQ
jgi:hypothetical protein